MYNVAADAAMSSAAAIACTEIWFIETPDICYFKSDFDQIFVCLLRMSYLYIFHIMAIAYVVFLIKNQKPP